MECPNHYIQGVFYIGCFVLPGVVVVFISVNTVSIKPMHCLFDKHQSPQR